MKIDQLTVKAREALASSRDLAIGKHHAEIGAEHLLVALLDQEGGVVPRILAKLGADPRVVKADLERAMERLPRAHGAALDVDFGRSIKDTWENAAKQADEMKDEYISTEHFLLALAAGKTAAGEALRAAGASKDAILGALVEVRGNQRVTDDDPEAKYEALDRYCRDLTRLAQQGKLDPVIGRDEEIRRTIQILSRRTKNNPVLVGEAGVGKTAVVEGIAQRIARGDVPESLRDKKLLSLDLGALIAAARLSHRYIPARQLPDKAIDLVDEAASRLKMEIESTPTPIDQLERRVATLEVERAALEREKKDDRRARQRLPEVEREIAELKEQASGMKARWQHERDVIKSLGDKKQKLEELKSEAERLQRTGDFARASELRFGTLPQLEKDIADETAKVEELRKQGSFLRDEVTEDDISTVVAKWTGIPVEKMLEGEVERLTKMEDRLRLRVVGQETAVGAVAAAVRRARAGLKDPNRPVGSFLFLGPTGVGKTELARALAEFLFDDEHAMVRIDMSEYQEKHTVSRLVGAPPGYVGYDQGGQLTEAVRRHPYSVVLLDEMEKAHPDVWSVLLQVLDDGRLTDGQGRTVDFRNTVVIMTSNVGSQHLLKLSADNRAQVEQLAMRELQAHFRPEFLNRIDEIIFFEPLGEAELAKIVRIQVERFAKLLAERQITLHLSDQAVARVAEAGYDPIYGARPLKRALQKLVIDPLATRLLSGDFQPGDHVEADVSSGDIVFHKSVKGVAA